ncbi:cytochrome P450 [Novispirillum sp. DQ9]|uniref:cytochrome P450 n=1 Tax=Novispirillum sp. DQ9 TaxID=3398612 RepID=UPI003C798771
MTSQTIAPRFDPYSPAFDADPFPTYKVLRDHAPCFWSEEARMWVLTRYDDVMNALSDWQTYSSAKGNLMDEFPGRAGNTLGTMDPPRHDQVRAIIQSVFAKRNLNHLVAPIQGMCRAALADLKGREVFDYAEDYSARITVNLLFTMLGLPQADDTEVRDKAVLMVQSDPVTRQKGAEHLAAFEWVKDFASEVIAQRAKTPTDDLISSLILAEVDGQKLDLIQVQMTVTTLIMAGIESLSGFLNMLALNLADFPDQRAKLLADPSLISNAVEESLRYNTTAQRFRRCLTRDVTLHGQTMKAGDFVALCYGSANRDDRKYDNPDVYDVTRNAKGHAGLGGGVHSCLGNSIARLASQVIIEEFLAEIPHFSRVDETLKWVPSSTFRSPLELRLKRA